MACYSWKLESTKSRLRQAPLHDLLPACVCAASSAESFSLILVARLVAYCGERAPEHGKQGGKAVAWHIFFGRMAHEKLSWDPHVGRAGTKP